MGTYRKHSEPNAVNPSHQNLPHRGAASRRSFAFLAVAEGVMEVFAGTIKSPRGGRSRKRQPTGADADGSGPGNRRKVSVASRPDPERPKYRRQLPDQRPGRRLTIISDRETGQCMAGLNQLRQKNGRGQFVQVSVEELAVAIQAKGGVGAITSCIQTASQHRQPAPQGGDRRWSKRCLPPRRTRLFPARLDPGLRWGQNGMSLR